MYFFDFKYEGGSIIVYYQDDAGEPKDIDSDLLIAADGPSSKIRQLLLPEV
jgi:hypothetical protein